MKPRAPISTAAKATAAREYLGLSKAAMARALRLASSNGRNTVHGYETGSSIPGPVQLAYERLMDLHDSGRGLGRKK